MIRALPARILRRSLFTSATVRAATWCALAVGLLASTASARQLPPIQLDLDHASFAYDAEQSMVELYLAFEAASLSFRSDANGFRAVLPVDLEIVRATVADPGGAGNEPVWSDSLDLSFVIADTSGLQLGQQFAYRVQAAVPSGEYEVVIAVQGDEAGGQSSLSLRREIVVPNYSDSDRPEMSDVTLASEVRRAESRDEPFYKNGLVVRPNANQLFGVGLPNLFWYAEAYALDRLNSPSGNYTVFSYIAEANLPQPLPDLQRRATRNIRTPDVLVGNFDLSALPSGSYFLRIALLNDDNEAVVERSRKFFVYNPGVAREQMAAVEEEFESSQYARMTEEEVEQAFRHVDIIATDNDRRRIGAIQDLDERRRFLMEFWRVRDPNPQTPVNEFQDQFYQRLQYANDRYTSAFDEGWKTDRGRAMIKYGPPTAVTPHLYDRGYAPYELWEYNNIPGEGQAIFVFADRDGYGLFELLHSSVSGERKMTNWLSELQR